MRLRFFDGNPTKFYDTLSSTTPALTVAGAGTAASARTYSYTNPSGGSSEYIVTYKAYTVQTSFGCTGVADYPATAQNLVDTIAQPDGTSYHFTYEPTSSGSGNVTGRVASVTLPTGATISYAYDAAPYQINCTDGTTQGFTRTVSNVPGGWGFWHGTGSSTTLETNARGDATHYQFAGPYEVQRQMFQGSGQSAALLLTVDTCYNGEASPCVGSAAPAQVTSVSQVTTLASGNLVKKTNTTYDFYGQPLEVDETGYGSGAPGGVLRKTVTSYASLGVIKDHPSLVQVFDGSGNLFAQTAYYYDNNGTPTATSGTPQLGTPGANRGNLTLIRKTVDASHTLDTWMSYFDTGNVSHVAYPNGATVVNTYGNCGNSFLSSTTVAGTSLTSSQTINCSGGVVTSATDPNGQVSGTTYGDANFWRPTATTDATKAQTTLAYLTNPSATESTLTFSGGVAVKDVRTTLDSLGRTSVTQVLQTGTSNYTSSQTTYTPLGQVATTTTVPYTAGAGGAAPSGAYATSTAYDALGRPVTVTNPDGGVTSYGYVGNDVMVTDANSKKRQLEYDALGRLQSVCEVTTAAGSGTCAQTNAVTGYWTKYTYDSLGDLLTVTQNAQSASTQTRSFSYDWLGRQLTASNPESGATRSTYDTDATCGTSKGNLVKTVDANGNVICYTYDGLSRVTAVTYPSGPNAAGTPAKYFVYDAATVGGIALHNTQGRLAEAYTGTAGAKITDLGLSYSARGEVTDTIEATPNSGGYYHVGESYWEDGSVQVLTPLLGSLPSWIFHPDVQGRLYSVTAATGQNPLIGTWYDITGQPLSVLLGSNDYDVFDYQNPMGRLDAYQNTVSNKSLYAGLTWNPNGTLQQFAETDQLNPANTQTCQYGYDDLVRLTSANCGSLWNQTFSFDAFGNISKSGSISFQPTYNGANQYKQLPAGSPAYDANGNVTNDGFHNYIWDADGHSTQIGTNAEMTQPIIYDALGRWVEKTNGKVTSQAVYAPDGSRLAVMYGQTVGSAYLRMPGGAIAMYKGNTVYSYWHADWLGTPRVYSSPNRVVNADNVYAPFGEQYAGAAGDTFWTGTAQSNEAPDMKDFPAREYHTTEGRWLSPDPGNAGAVLENPQTWNAYAYVGNNPLSVVDPSGMGSCSQSNNYCGFVVFNTPSSLGLNGFQTWDPFGLTSLSPVTIAYQPPTTAGSMSSVSGGYLLTGTFITDPGWTITASPFLLYAGMFDGLGQSASGSSGGAAPVKSKVCTSPVYATARRFVTANLSFAQQIASQLNTTPGNVLGLSGNESGWGTGFLISAGTNNYFSLTAGKAFTGTIGTYQHGGYTYGIYPAPGFLTSGQSFANSFFGNRVKGIKDPSAFAEALNANGNFNSELLKTPYNIAIANTINLTDALLTCH